MNIEKQIKLFARKRNVKPEDFEKFRATILQGLPAFGLRTDKIELAKYKALAARKDAQALAKKKEVDLNDKPDKGGND